VASLLALGLPLPLPGTLALALALRLVLVLGEALALREGEGLPLLEGEVDTLGLGVTAWLVSVAWAEGVERPVGVEGRVGDPLAGALPVAVTDTRTTVPLASSDALSAAEALGGEERVRVGLAVGLDVPLPASRVPEKLGLPEGLAEMVV